MKRFLNGFFFLSFCLILKVDASNQSEIDSVWKQVNTAKNPADVTASLIVLNELLITVDPDTTYYFFERVTQITNKALKQHPDANTKKNLYINLAAVTSNLAYVDQLKGNYVSALNLFNKALAILKKYPRADYEGILLNNVGIIHLEMQDYDNALYYYQMSEKIQLQENNKPGLALAYGNIGNVLKKKGQMQKAEEYLFKGLAIYESIGDSIGWARMHSSIASFYASNQEYQKALNEYRIIENFVTKRVNFNLYSEMLNNLAYINNKIGNTNEAKIIALKAIPVVKRNGELSSEMLLSKLLSEIYAKEGKWNEAYKFQKIYITLNDTLSKNDNKKAALRQSFQYEYDKQKELDKKENEKLLAIQEAKTQRQRLITLFFSIGLIVISALSLLIYKRWKITRNQKEVIEQQKDILEIKNSEITQSITYARRIQAAILPSEKSVQTLLKDSFIVYLPKDIVAGDFYWLEHVDGKIYIAACDCTGHGVPGAMVSVLCNSALNRAINEFGKRLPGEIFDKTRALVLESFSKSDDEVKDGMDASLACLDIANDTLKWSGANNPLWIYRHNNKLIEEVKPDKQPIGEGYEFKPFTTHQLNLEKGDIIYLFTDGLADQFGGIKGKKLTKAKLREFMLTITQHSMIDQRNELLNFYKQYKGNTEQVDDICFIGVKV